VKIRGRTKAGNLIKRQVAGRMLPEYILLKTRMFLSVGGSAGETEMGGGRILKRDDLSLLTIPEQFCMIPQMGQQSVQLTPLFKKNFFSFSPARMFFSAILNARGLFSNTPILVHSQDYPCHAFDFLKATRIAPISTSLKLNWNWD
jgi:hypothetical protein